MTDLAIRNNQLPDRIEDVARFLLIAPEKAKALRAEIQAIKNLHLAQEVYDQKMDEQRRLQELILDASVKIGEFTKALHKSLGGRPEKTPDSTDQSFRGKKQTAIENLGFSVRQANRFETLANNQDLVEQVKAEARENGTAPTRQKVLDLAKARREIQERENRQDDADHRAMMEFTKITRKTDIYRIDDAMIAATARTDPDIADTIQTLENLISALTIIKNKLCVERSKASNGQKYGIQP